MHKRGKITAFLPYPYLTGPYPTTKIFISVPRQIIKQAVQLILQSSSSSSQARRQQQQPGKEATSISSRTTPCWNLTVGAYTIGKSIVLRFFWCPIIVYTTSVSGDTSIPPSTSISSCTTPCWNLTVGAYTIGKSIVLRFFWCPIFVYMTSVSGDTSIPPSTEVAATVERGNNSSSSSSTVGR